MGPKRKSPAGALQEATRGPDRCEWSLLPQAEALDQRAVTVDVAALQVCEEAAAIAHHGQQTPARMEILDVRFEMLGEHVDALGEERNLDLGGTGVALRALVLRDDARLVCGGHGHGQNLRELLLVMSSRLSLLFY